MWPTNPTVARVVSHASLRHTHRRCASISTSSAAAPPASCRPARSGCGRSSRRTQVRWTRLGPTQGTACVRPLVSPPPLVIPLLRLLARLARHRSRRPRPPPRVRRHRRGAPPGARPAVELTSYLPSLGTHSISHLPSTPPGAGAVGAAVHTAAPHRRRLVRAAPRRSSEEHPPPLCARPRLTARRRLPHRAPLQVRAARAGGRPVLQNEVEGEARVARPLRGALQPAARRGAAVEGGRRLRLRLELHSWVKFYTLHSDSSWSPQSVPLVRYCKATA